MQGERYLCDTVERRRRMNRQPSAFVVLINGKPTRVGINEIIRLKERDIPKKVIIHENEGAFECSNCLETGNTDSMWLFTEIGEYDYCPRCGHVLDWEDEDE
jgi:predicted RNA-binding Zn-ribbon protein involved in translation (DUF1610 family)